MPTSVHTGAKDSARIRSPSSCVGVDLAPARHPERDDLGRLEVLLGEQREQLLLLRVRRGEAGLDHVHAERVERVHDAQLLICGEAHAAAAHAVAQGGVVELDVGHRAYPVTVGAAAERGAAADASPVGVWSADGETTSSHSR